MNCWQLVHKILSPLLHNTQKQFTFPLYHSSTISFPRSPWNHQEFKIRSFTQQLPRNIALDCPSHSSFIKKYNNHKTAKSAVQIPDVVRFFTPQLRTHILYFAIHHTTSLHNYLHLLCKILSGLYIHYTPWQWLHSQPLLQTAVIKSSYIHLARHW